LSDAEVIKAMVCATAAAAASGGQEREQKEDHIGADAI
jgi:hypothetical protein